MGIDFNLITEDTINFSYIPETIPSYTKDALKTLKSINSDVDGYTKGRNGRLIGTIPPEVLYNVAMLKGIPSHKHQEYWMADNGKNIRKFLKDKNFEAFRMVDQL